MDEEISQEIQCERHKVQELAEYFESQINQSSLSLETIENMKKWTGIMMDLLEDIEESLKENNIEFVLFVENLLVSTKNLITEVQKDFIET